MNRRRGHPREDQVAELTRGHRLPLAPLHETHLILIAETLSRAWRDLLVEHRSTLLSGQEVELKSFIESRLNALVDEEGLWSQLVRGVARGEETLSFDASHLEKQPGLNILLTNRSPAFPLLVECKLTDAPARKRIKLYCDDGLVRFVKGEYGWAGREAFMLAYVRDGSTISSCLYPFLAESQSQVMDSYLTGTLPESKAAESMCLARSSHHRAFRYLGLEHDDPGPIAIWHLWLVAGPP